MKYCKVCGKQLINGKCPSCGWHSVEQEKQQTYIKKDKSKKQFWICLYVVMVLLPFLLNSSFLPFRDIAKQLGESDFKEEVYVDDKEYKNVKKSLSQQGTHFTKELTNGNYIVGVDIPEGNYNIEIIHGFANIMITDKVNDIDLSYSITRKDTSAKHPHKLMNIHLYNGAIIMISHNESVLSFTTENAQKDSLKSLPVNKKVEDIKVDKYMIAGIDYPEGTYDFRVDGGTSGYVNIDYPDRYKDCLHLNGTLGKKNKTYKNVELPKGTSIEVSGNLEIFIVPSERNSLERKDNNAVNLEG